MSALLLERLFRAQAQESIRETAELLRYAPTFPVTWEEFFRRLHDLKAQALSAHMKTIAQELHQLEDLLWSKQNDLATLQHAQKTLELLFSHNDLLDGPLHLKDVLTVLAQQMQLNGAEIGKTLDVRVLSDGIDANDEMPPSLYPALVHLVHNALTHGVGVNGQVWLKAYYAKKELVLEVEDDGGDDKSRDRLPSMLSGRGVGLSSIRATMKRLKGEFTLEDSLSGGTKARLRMPKAS